MFSCFPCCHVFSCLQFSMFKVRFVQRFHFSRFSCFDCSCIKDTRYGYCENGEVINPGYNYGKGIILTEGNGYIGKIGSELYLDRQYKPSVYYTFSLSEVISVGVVILSIVIFNEIPNINEIIGGLIVIGSVLKIHFENIKNTKI